MSAVQVPYSLYIHIPFCRQQRCAYCDFNSRAGWEELIPDYTAALCAEIKGVGASSPEKLFVHSIFFGGGTPSLLPAPEVEKILTSIASVFTLEPGTEITLEANPGTVDYPYLKTISSLGINRLSLGMQSARPNELALLGRQHLFSHVRQAVLATRRAGINNLNLDLIYGIPHQTLSTWKASLQAALGLQPEHLSLYALTLDEHVPLRQWIDSGAVESPDENLAADMYEAASEILEKTGFGQYEISNWARLTPEKQLLSCRHNLQYWRCMPYLGFGAGAAGYARHTRLENEADLEAYISCFENPAQVYFPYSPATSSIIELTRQDEKNEMFMLGLRLTAEGVSRKKYLACFGSPPETDFKEPLTHLEKAGLIKRIITEDDVHYCLTKQARLIGNQAFMHFV